MTEKEMWNSAGYLDSFLREMDLAGIPNGDHRRKLTLVRSYSDRNLWVDVDGNYWEEYVPTFD